MAGKYKRIYLGIGATLISLFTILTIIGLQITSDGDKICQGTELDPCISYLTIYNPTAKSVYIYNKEEVTLDFSPDIERYELYVEYYGKWVPMDFTMETRLGNVPKDRLYVFVFPRYSTKKFKLVGYKNNPTDQELVNTVKSFLLESKDIIESRHAKSNEALISILNEQIDKWRSFARLVENYGEYQVREDG